MYYLISWILPKKLTFALWWGLIFMVELSRLCSVALSHNFQIFFISRVFFNFFCCFWNLEAGSPGLIIPAGFLPILQEQPRQTKLGFSSKSKQTLSLSVEFMYSEKSNWDKIVRYFFSVSICETWKQLRSDQKVLVKAVKTKCYKSEIR